MQGVHHRYGVGQFGLEAVLRGYRTGGLVPDGELGIGEDDFLRAGLRHSSAAERDPEREGTPDHAALPWKSISKSLTVPGASYMAQ